MLLLTMQALAELGVMYPVNGAFFSYYVRFIDKSWGFACGWDCEWPLKSHSRTCICIDSTADAIQWLTILPFEITAAGITIGFWAEGAKVNIGEICTGTISHNSD